MPKGKGKGKAEERKSPAVRTITPAAGSSRAPTASASRSKWRFDGVEVPPRRTPASSRVRPAFQSPSPRRPSSAAAGPSTPYRAFPGLSQLLSPEVPSPATAARKRAPAAGPASEDDYDAWEVPMCVDEPDLSPGDADEEDVVPDSQPDAAAHEDDSDSLVPSFMKAPYAREDAHLPSDDTLPDTGFFDHAHGSDNEDEDTSDDANPGVSRRVSPHRTHTAPAELLHPHVDEFHHADERSTLPRRARTAEAQLEELCDAFAADGSQWGVDELLAVEARAEELRAAAKEKLSRKLGGGTAGSEGNAGAGQ